MKISNLFHRQYRSPEEKKIWKIELLLGLGSGLLLGLSYPPIPLPFLAFISFVPYFYVIERRNGLGEINRFTYFTMFFFNLITLYWVGSWTPEADPFLKISGVALVFFNPCLFLIPSTLYHFTRKYVHRKAARYLFPLFWIFYEYMYGVTEFRFPWLTLGNSQAYFLSFIQIADVVGVFGISLIIIYINIFIYKSIHQFFVRKQPFLKPAIAAISVLIFVLIYGLAQDSGELTSGRKIKVGLIQPNLNPWNKWETGGLNEQLQMYLDLSAKAVKAGAEIVIWPETALPVYLMGGSYPIRVKRIQNFVNSNRVPILTGMPDAKIFRKDDKNIPAEAKTSRLDYRYVSYNSILLFLPGNNFVQKYQKMKLVPFGEKTPYVEHFPFIENLIKWNVGISAWNVGKSSKVLEAEINNKTIAIGGIICIESIYPVFVSEFVEKGADFITVVTNDSWYGNSSGPYQHKAISVLRAVENRRSVVRCANGGISCVILPDGTTESATEMFTKNVLVEDVVIKTKKSFYTNHARLLPGISISIVVIVMLLVIANRFFKLKINFGRVKNENN